MNEVDATALQGGHSHVFLGEGHESSEKRTWTVIWLCGAMMVMEILGGLMFGSIALVADGLHMSTHAGALLLAALAYSYSRKHASDPRYSFGTGKLGDLAGFTSAIVLAMIALLIGYESLSRFLAPVPIHFTEALPIAVLGLLVNVGSVFLLSGGGHHHHHGHAHGHGHDDHDDHDHHHDESHRIETAAGAVVLSIFEEDVAPVFRLRHAAAAGIDAGAVAIETVRPGGISQRFAMVDRGAYLESAETIPEPHAFTAHLCLAGARLPVVFEDHGQDDAHPHEAAHRDNNMRAAIVHVVADAAVSVLVILGLILAWTFGWLWMDPLAGIVGACVIASWAYGLVRDTGAILLDMNPDPKMADSLRAEIETDGDRLTDLHLWRLGPGHLGAIIAVATAQERGAAFYRSRLKRFKALSHVTIEVEPASLRQSQAA